MDTLEHPKSYDGLIHDVAVTVMSGMVFNPMISQLLPKEEGEAKKVTLAALGAAFPEKQSG